MFGAEGGGGGVTAHTHVSGEMVKPSMYNCLTLIKGEGREGLSRAKSPVSKPGGGFGDLDPSRLL